MTPVLATKATVTYPDSDGKPMADNTIQYRWIQTIHGGLDAQYRDDQNIFVAADLLIYAVDGDPTVRVAPDIFVAYGRPKGERGSYRVFDEGGIFPQVVFEILSPGNRHTEMAEKWEFYNEYGAEEYYLYDPDRIDLTVWHRDRGRLRVVHDVGRWVSPRAQIRFDLSGPELVVFGANGQPFVNYVELSRQRDAERQKALAAEMRADAAEAELVRLRALMAQQTGANGS
jgi:Uma2 family endonuclease